MIFYFLKKEYSMILIIGAAWLMMVLLTFALIYQQNKLKLYIRNKLYIT